MNFTLNSTIFTKPKLEEFKAEYTKAINEDKSEFIFEGKIFIIGYAKYVIEYLEFEFSKNEKC